MLTLPLIFGIALGVFAIKGLKGGPIYFQRERSDSSGNHVPAKYLEGRSAKTAGLLCLSLALILIATDVAIRVLAARQEAEELESANRKVKPVGNTGFEVMRLDDSKGEVRSLREVQAELRRKRAADGLSTEKK